LAGIREEALTAFFLAMTSLDDALSGLWAQHIKMLQHNAVNIKVSLFITPIIIDYLPSITFSSLMSSE
jgi:hypothetical protein